MPGFENHPTVLKHRLEASHRPADGVPGSPSPLKSADLRALALECGADDIGHVRKERNIVWAILRRQVKVRGPLRLLQAFGRCFPS